MPQDVRLSPDGRTFYVADMGTNELRLINARTFRQVGGIGTPSDPHGLYPSRDGRRLYVSDRGAGEVSVRRLRDRQDRGHLDRSPAAAAPTWAASRPTAGCCGSRAATTAWSTAFDTRTGRLVARIPVGGSPHGLAVWPQPGRYSLGHTGNMR